MNEIQRSDINGIQFTDTNKTNVPRSWLIKKLYQYLETTEKNKSSVFGNWLAKKIPVYLETLVAAKELEEYGFRTKSHILELAVIIVFLGLCSIIMSALSESGWLEILKVTMPLGVAVIAYRQWRAARHETSIDKYYDRLEVVNKRLQDVSGDKPTPDDLHAFAELDKLEYVVVKYEHGYITPVLALRAVENFKALCRDRRGFSELASGWVGKAAYREVTRQVAKNVCEKCRSSAIPEQHKT